MKDMLVLVVAVCAAWPALAADPSARFCRVTALSEEPVCHVSHFQLAAHPDAFDGKLVVFSSVGRKIRGGPLQLFYSVEAAERAHADDTILILGQGGEENLDDAISDGFVRVYGRFRARPEGSPEEGVGKIVDLVKIFNEISPYERRDMSGY